MAEGLAALGLEVERVPDLGGEDVGEIGPELGPQRLLFGSLLELHGLVFLSTLSPLTLGPGPWPVPALMLPTLR